ncbi:Sodium-potassium/proton antiporter ChaA [Rhodoplanes serenus]|uniref:Sodium-potassium/proton antiporter ChaA n=1 Tax=Rhodoplanes serenus TaxID=200615 RepID=A0A447D0Q4_9BRAD|nr:calcium:proton antiporter [Rhodoplanes serenus]VCU11109.1 Sodium-potassium/proton antiporter ChaA [Rhodoplanes serenus]
MSRPDPSLYPSTTEPSGLRAVLPPVTVLRLATAWAVLAAFRVGGAAWLAAPAPIAAVAFAVLLAAIMTAAFAVVREADRLADRLGEPYGTLILTLSVVAIEVILIVAVMLGPGDAPTIGRDSIFAVMMIILALVVGLCVLAGGLRHREQSYNAQGAVAYLSMTGLLVGAALVLPNATGPGDGTVRPGAALALAAITVVTYGAFLAMQTGRWRRLFVQPEAGALAVPPSPSPACPHGDAPPAAGPAGARRIVVARAVVLVAALLPIVLLAHDLAVLVDRGIAGLGAPPALGGLLIAIIVFTPESITAVGAAWRDAMQRTVNLCLGAFLSTVGLTVPAVLLVGLATGTPVVMGIGPAETVLLVLTLGLTGLTFLGQRTSPIQGIAHLALFALYVVVLFGA